MAAASTVPCGFDHSGEAQELESTRVSKPHSGRLGKAKQRSQAAGSSRPITSLTGAILANLVQMMSFLLTQDFLLKGDLFSRHILEGLCCTL